MSVTRKASLAVAALFLLITAVWPIAGPPPIAHAEGGTFPAKPWKDKYQIKYDVTGATLGTSEDYQNDIGTVYRLSYDNMKVTGQVLTLSGTATGTVVSGCETYLEATVTGGGVGNFKTVEKGPFPEGPFSVPFEVSIAEIHPTDYASPGFAVIVETVCGLWNYRLQVDGEDKTPAPTPTPAPTATATPAAQRTIKGKVYAKDLNSFNVRDTLPIGGAKVILLQKDKQLAQTTSDKTDGSFTLRAPIAAGLTISVTLALAVSQPSPFVVVYGQSLEPVSATSKPFDLTRNSPEPTTVDLVLDDPDKTVPGRGIPANRMNDLGTLYYYVYQSWETATGRLGQKLDYDLPLFVRAFGPCGNDGDTAFWSPPGSARGLPDHPTICLDDMNSNTRRRDFAPTVAHEFGHHVMGDVFGNYMHPLNSTSKNHGGVSNSNSSDSWKEGFATFYSALVQRETLKKSRPELWAWGNNTINLEVNYSAWLAWGSSPLEEFAVASLLWDLVDPVDASDSTPMKAMLKDENGDPWPQSFGITLTTPIAVEKPTVQYADRVQMDLAKFWAIFTKDNAGVDPSPEAQPGFKFIYDMRQLYSVLKANGVGSDQTPNKITALDELFIAHGYFADTTPQNLIYDSGEAVGFTNNLPLAVKGVSYPQRDVRRVPPPIPNSYISFDAVDGAGKKVDATEFKVEVRFDAPFDKYSYTYETTASTPGMLFFASPDPRYPVKTYITAVGPIQESTTPLEVSNSLYWKSMAAQPQGSFMKHTFKMQAPGAATKGQGDRPAGSSAAAESTSSLAGSILYVLLGGGLLVVVGVIWRRRAPKSRTNAANEAVAAPVTDVCAQCGTALRPDAPFCPGCGQRIVPEPPPVSPPGPTFCGHCGEGLKAGARFCESCGHPVAVPTSTSQAAPVRPSAPQAPIQRSAPSASPRSGNRLLVSAGIGFFALALVFGGYRIVFKEDAPARTTSTSPAAATPTVASAKPATASTAPSAKPSNAPASGATTPGKAPTQSAGQRPPDSSAPAGQDQVPQGGGITRALGVVQTCLDALQKRDRKAFDATFTPAGRTSLGPQLWEVPPIVKSFKLSLAEPPVVSGLDNGMRIRVVNDVTYQNGPQVQQLIDLRVILVNGQWLIDGE